MSLAAGCGSDDPEGEATNLGEDAATSSTLKGGTSTSVANPQGECEIQGGIGTQGTDVILTLSEFKISPSVSRAAAGIVSFVAENTGQEDHEVVVVQADSAESLPRDADGALDKAKLAEGALIGEIEPMAPGQVCRGNFALQAGRYVLACNVVEEEENGVKESHLAEGMHVDFALGAL